MAGSFSAQLGAWAAKTKERLHAVRADAAQDLVEAMQLPGPSVAKPGGGAGGNMPIASGYLRASLIANVGFDVPLTTINPNPDGAFSFDGASVVLTIKSAAFDQPVTLAYTATYARKVEERYAFVRLATQRWPQFVAASASRAEAAVKSQ